MQWALSECRTELLSRIPSFDDSNHPSSRDSIGTSSNLVGSADREKGGGTGLDSASQNLDVVVVSIIIYSPLTL